MLVTSIFSFSQNAFSSTCHRPVSLCHGPLSIVFWSVGPSVCVSVSLCVHLSVRRSIRALTFSLNIFSESTCLIFSSTVRRPASYCHGVVSVMRPSVPASAVHSSVCASVNFAFEKLILRNY